MDFFDRLLDVISDFAKEIRDRFGAWIVDSLGRLLKRLLKATAKFLYITISMLCPYFAWASVGEYLIWHGGWLLGALGAFIVMLFPCFVLALLVMKGLQGATSESSVPQPESPQATKMDSEPGDEAIPWYSRLGTTLLNLFVSEGKNTAAYYGIFVAGAILITGMMLFSNAGKELSDSNFGAINTAVLRIIARGPVLFATTVYSMYSGISLSWDMTVFESVLGLPKGTGALGYISAMTLVAITIALAGWFLYRFSQPPALQAAEAFQTDPVNFSSVPPTAKPHVQEKQESGLFVVLLAVILIALSVVGADWFFKIGLVPWAR